MTEPVALVGAGPGGAGLLTLAGREAIAHAQVLAYDSLVSPDILALAPEGASRIPVTRRSDPDAVRQEDIVPILAQKAKAGFRVVRLKGGDPFLYGRGYEEKAAMEALDVPVEVIPGLTAALAVPACAGIPVTCGDLSGSVHILSGSPRTGKTLELDYEALVRVGGTLVFLMAMENLEAICAGLLAVGLPPDTPASLVENGALLTQRRVNATAETLPRAAREAAVKEPAVLVLGEVCGL
ncbi:Porphyrin biosynthesis protein HemD (Includes: Uroporphyrinogen-III C-methyltransferase; Uroporphyrinogen-III synthase) (fragment) [uncultured Eubacteriales bacterium]|uniref:uroporphyrinogen-III C-methyltransferase n=1 Tax=uncultured Eubacteriales bacterium TaxID=172733 RepID=A0A212K8T3_9FIRM